LKRTVSNYVAIKLECQNKVEAVFLLTDNDFSRHFFSHDVHGSGGMGYDDDMND